MVKIAIASASSRKYKKPYIKSDYKTGIFLIVLIVLELAREVIAGLVATRKHEIIALVRKVNHLGSQVCLEIKVDHM